MKKETKEKRIARQFRIEWNEWPGPDWKVREYGQMIALFKHYADAEAFIEKVLMENLNG